MSIALGLILIICLLLGWGLYREWRRYDPYGANKLALHSWETLRGNRHN